MGKKARKAGAPVEADHGEKKKVKRGKKKGRKAAVKGKSKGGKRGILWRAGSSRHADVPDPEEEVQPRAKRSRMVKSAKKASDETAPKPKAKSARKPESGEETPAKPKRGRKAKSETAPAPEAKSAGKASAKTASKKKAPEAIAKRAPKAKSAPKAKARAIRAADEAPVVDPAEARDMVGLGPGPGNLNLDADLTTYLRESVQPFLDADFDTAMKKQVRANADRPRSSRLNIYWTRQAVSLTMKGGDQKDMFYNSFKSERRCSTAVQMCMAVFAASIFVTGLLLERRCNQFLWLTK